MLTSDSIHASRHTNRKAATRAPWPTTSKNMHNGSFWLPAHVTHTTHEDAHCTQMALFNVSYHNSTIGRARGHARRRHGQLHTHAWPEATGKAHSTGQAHQRGRGSLHARAKHTRCSPHGTTPHTRPRSHNPAELSPPLSATMAPRPRHNHSTALSATSTTRPGSQHCTHCNRQMRTRCFNPGYN